MIEFRILGPLEVVQDEAPLALGGQKRVRCSGFLLMRAVRSWQPSASSTSCGVSGRRPRRRRSRITCRSSGSCWAPSRIVTRPPGYALQINGGSLDLARFEQLVAAARSADAAERAAMLSEALSLWRGPPLADLAFETFAEQVRRLEELRLDAIEERVDAQLELGESSALVPELEGLVKQYPLRERLRGHDARALPLRLGGEALDVYHDARKTLSDEPGSTPAQGSAARIDSPPGIGPHPQAIGVAADRSLRRDRRGDARRAGRGRRGGRGNQAPDGQRAIPGLDEIAAYLADAFGSPPEHRSLARVSSMSS